MTLALYFDQHVSGAAAIGLQNRGVDVLTAEADGHKQATDEELLRRATELRRMLVTNDDDFLTIAAEWRHSGSNFAGIAFMTSQDIRIGRLIDDLEPIARTYSDDEAVNHIEYLPP